MSNGLLMRAVAERIANDVLSLSRIQLQVLTVHSVEFDLVSEITSIMSVFKNELKMKKIGYELTFGDSIKQLGIARVSADKARFAQVMSVSFPPFSVTTLRS
jgi:signal transduction histidine kinase